MKKVALALVILGWALLVPVPAHGQQSCPPGTSDPDYCPAEQAQPGEPGEPADPSPQAVRRRAAQEPARVSGTRGQVVIIDEDGNRLPFSGSSLPTSIPDDARIDVTRGRLSLRVVDPSRTGSGRIQRVLVSRGVFTLDKRVEGNRIVINLRLVAGRVFSRRLRIPSGARAQGATGHGHEPGLDGPLAA